MEARLVRIFLVDEHPLVRDGLKLHLRGVPNFEVVGEASNAATALERIESACVDVVLMDIGANELSGIELDVFIRRLAHTAVLVLSWRAQPATVTRAMRAGARGFVLKDTPAQQILDAIQTVAVGRICLGSGIAGGLFQATPWDSELSRREREVLRWVGQGKPSKVIANQLGISLRTIESHRQNIKRKLQLDGHAALIKYAVERAGYSDSGTEAEPAQPSVRASCSWQVDAARLNGHSLPGHGAVA